MKNEILGQDQNRKLLEISVKKDKPALLIGETGTGKTSIIRELAAKEKKNLIRVNLNGSTSTDEFVGKWLIKNKSTVWQDGVLVNAMRNGDWILCDEINAALPEILFVLHSLLDDDKFVVLTEKDGEVVKPHADFRFFGTMNPFEDYAGTKELNRAFLNRFPIVLHFEYVDSGTEAKIVKDRTGIAEDMINLMVNVAAKARELKNRGDLYTTVSTRDLLHWGELTSELGSTEGNFMLAFKISILNKAHSDDQELLCDIIARQKASLITLLKKHGAASYKDLIGKLEEREKNISKAEEFITEKVKSLDSAYMAKSLTLKQEFDLKEAIYIRKQKAQEHFRDNVKANLETVLEPAVVNQLLKLVDEAHED